MRWDFWRAGRRREGVWRFVSFLIVAGALAAVAAPSVLSAPPASTDTARPTADARVHLGGGLTLPVPAGWHLSTRLTQLVAPDGSGAPAERFTLSSAPPAHSRRIDSCGPLTAVRRLGRAEALAFVFEYEQPYRRSGFPPRPRRFRLPAVEPVSFECFGVGWLLRLGDRGRAFQVMVALGQDARGAAAERRLLGTLDRLVVARRSEE